MTVLGAKQDCRIKKTHWIQILWRDICTNNIHVTMPQAGFDHRPISDYQLEFDSALTVQANTAG